MASTSSSSRGGNAEILKASRKSNSTNKGNNIPNERETSPERSKAWAEACNGNNNKNGVGESRRVPVVYYLSRNGQLEHPHFMEVPLSSNRGLYLRDVINRLNHLRGKGMASLYSWSAKRSYKKGFVWHDLSEDDLINPTHASLQEYVLKGSELLLLPEPPPQQQHQIFSSSDNNNNSNNIGHLEASSFRYPKEYPGEFSRRRNKSWSAIDLNEYKVYKAVEECSSESSLRTDAATQTEERNGMGKGKGRPRRRARGGEIEEVEEVGNGDEIEEVSPPPSDSSPETLESLMKADGRLVLTAPPASQGLNVNIDNKDNTGTGEGGSGKMKASTVLMQLISCGSLSFRDCGASAVKEQGMALIGGYKGRLPRGSGRTTKENVSFPRVKLEDKEYFSGSLVETKIEKGEDLVTALKRSNSCNADR